MIVFCNVIVYNDKYELQQHKLTLPREIVLQNMTKMLSMCTNGYHLVKL